MPYVVARIIDELQVDTIGRIRSCPTNERSLVFKGLLFGKDYLVAQTLIQAIPADINSLSLSENYLFNYNKDLPSLLRAIPESVSSLDLSGNSFGTMDEVFYDTSRSKGQRHTLKTTATAFRSALAAIPRSVRSLDLRDNNLANIETNVLVGDLSALPRTLKSVNLSNNGLLTKSPQDLAKIHAALPAHVHLNFILDSYLEKRMSVRGFDGQPLQYYFFNLSSFFKRTFSFTSKRDAITALKSALMGNFEPLLPYSDVLMNGSLGQALLQFSLSDKSRDIVGRPTSSLYDFIVALQAKITPDARDLVCGSPGS